MNHRIICLTFFFTILIFQLVMSPSASYGEEPSKRPKIGLVLGGGGARGAAHVGILKVIEEQHIPIDFVVGTSMGAIVGGAYAAGLSPEEIESTLNGIDWEDLFIDDAPREQLSFRHKLDERKFTGVELGIKNGKVLLPRGAFAGRKLEFLLQSVFLHTAQYDSFDQLGIPFRAVATNIETGDAVVLKSGSLALAIRASMSIPGAFSPVEIDGNLVDGYVSKNVPIDVAKEMGADIIIAVDVGTPLAKREDLNTMLDIINQVGGIATIKNVEEQVRLLTPNDLLIRPDLGDYSTTDFGKIQDIIPLGESAARHAVEELKRFSSSETVYQSFLVQQRKKPMPPLTLNFIKIAPMERVSQERVEARLTLQPGTILDIDQLNKDLTNVQSIGEFEQVGFSLAEEDNKTGIVLQAKEKSWGPNYLRFGLNLNSDFNEDNYFNILVDHRLTSINDFGAEWENELQFGRTSKVATEFYQPLDYGDRFFIEPRLEWRQDLRDIYDNGTRLAEYRTRKYGAGGDFGVHFGTVAELRVGLWRGHLKADPSTGSGNLPDFDVDRGGAQIQFTYDQVDDSNFPRKGGYFNVTESLERSGLGGEDSYEKTDIAAMYAISLGAHTLLPRFSLGLSLDDDLPFYDEFLLGGASTLSGFNADELHGKQKGLFKLMYYYQLSKNLLSFARASYLGGSLDLGNVWQDHNDISFSDSIFGGSIFYATDTILGPLYVGYGLNEEARDGAFFLSLGQRM